MPGLTNRLLGAVRAGGGGDVRVDAGVLRQRRRSSAATRSGRSFSRRPDLDRSRRAMTQASVARGSSLWRLSGRARDQRGHGGGSAAAGGRRSASASHAPDGRARCGDGAHRLPATRGFRPTSSRSSTTWDGELGAGGRGRLPRRRDDAGGDDGGGKGGDSDSAADATDDHQRKNAEALARAGAAEVLLQKRADRRRRWPRAMLALAATAIAARAMATRGARAGAARRRAGDRRSRAGAGGAVTALPGADGAMLGRDAARCTSSASAASG